MVFACGHFKRRIGDLHLLTFSIKTVYIYQYFSLFLLGVCSGNQVRQHGSIAKQDIPSLRSKIIHGSIYIVLFLKSIVLFLLYILFFFPHFFIFFTVFSHFFHFLYAWYAFLPCFFKNSCPIPIYSYPCMQKKHKNQKV